MGAETKIEWCHATFNPWRGCSKVSEGCRNCYADTQAKRNPGVLGAWGPNGTRVVASESMWREPVKWDKAAKAAGERRRVFCSSMADVFEDWRGEIANSASEQLYVYDEGFAPLDGRSDIVWREGGWSRNSNRYIPGRSLTMTDVRRRLFDLICRTPHLDWLLLTKRPENALRMMVEAGLYAAENPALPRPQPNLWIGTSVENQQAADERIPHLLRVPAAVRFLSCEPLLGPVDLDISRWGGCFHAGHKGRDHEANHRECACHLDWVIVGGESGHVARPMHPEWARSIRDQCQAAGVAFHFKQHGEWGPVERFADFSDHSTAGRDQIWMYPDGRVDRPKTGPHAEAWPRRGTWLAKVGKANAGRLLDGRTWDEFPAGPANPPV